MHGAVFLLLGLLTCHFLPSFALGFAAISIKGNAIRAEIASSRAEQMLGLGNRDALGEGSGMLFFYETAGEKIIWMKRMRFAIDIIWILRGTVVHIEKNVPPPSPMMSSSRLQTYGHGIVADMVLEVAKGFADRTGLALGDPVRFQ